jgi:vitamin B12 transporter
MFQIVPLIPRLNLDPKFRKPSLGTTALISRGLACVIGLFLFASAARASEEAVAFDAQPLDSLVVTGSRLALSLKELGRSVDCLRAERLHAQSTPTLNEALQLMPGVDLMERAPFGVQAEAALRGAGYQQTSIVVDGLPVNDPQTAHHSLNVALPLLALDRMEVLKGTGAHAHGSNAVGGVLHLISQLPKRSGVNLSLQGGEHGLFLGGVSLAHVGATGQHQFTAQQDESQGWTEDSDFRNRTLHLRSRLPLALDLSLAWADRQFGASTFYTSYFPHQWEHTQTKKVQVGLPTRVSDFDLRFQLAYRQHDDHFLLNRQDPDFYENVHRNRSYTVSADLARSLFGGQLLLSALGERFRLESSSMGDRERLAGSLHLSHRLSKGPVHLGLAAVVALPESQKVVYMPSVNLALQADAQTTLIASYGGSWREPSFTELYYHSPTNVGNAELLPEEALGGEVGLRRQDKSLRTSLVFFERHTWNHLDWVRPSDEILKIDAPWQAKNIGRILTRGFEGSLVYSPAMPVLDEFYLSGTWIKATHRLDELESKYALNYLSHQLKAGLRLSLPYGLHLSVDSRHQRRRNQSAHWLGDMRLNAHPTQQLHLFADLRNIGDVKTEDQSGVPLPGRWFSVGLKLRFSHGTKR